MTYLFYYPLYHERDVASFDDTVHNIIQIEGYPVKDAKSDAYNYHGPISLFFSEGFSVIKELQEFFVMRKQL